MLSRYSIFCNVTLKNRPGSKYARAAGTYCQMLEVYDDENLAIIKLPTGLNKLLNLDSFVTLGRNSNLLNNQQVFGKAGYRVMSGHRPVVRGVARNPVDHPNGGRTKTNTPEKSL
jgi:large subunit ribosomal protein L2